MKKLYIIILICAFSGAFANAQKPKKAVKKAEPVYREIILPARCADCLFAINLDLDTAFGPTEPLNGPGYINEIKQDKKVKNVFEQEHNSVWYKVSIPYDGKLLIDVTPKSSNDDHDLLVYKYTDRYFCNRVERNKVTPVRSVMSSIDPAVSGKTGLRLNATDINIPKSSETAYAKYIDVKEGESYVIVLDNLNEAGLGHTIKVEVWTESTPLYIYPIDSISKQRTTANIEVIENETQRIVLSKEDAGAQKIKIMPTKTYTINLTKPNYFDYSKVVSYDQAKADSVLSTRLIEIKIGSNLPLNGTLYYDINEEGTTVLLKESLPVLDKIVETLRAYPKIQIEIIGRIPTEGLNVKADNVNSKARAEAIKAYLVSKGVDESSITTRGSTIKELEAQIKAQNENRNSSLINPQSEIRIKALK
ncbi:MAG: OmpA family protein [Bacteroidales bacterium]|jgi:outer membrane protein OmpA-like peptidoglycan-associated protein|nr:OmpA family protein [Bacteroidales bacterium]